ncbi:hypothetical protein KW792_00830 [Candidatus Saccharibacteria bacterium]|nr:hypothetical protein [Candidatus Saccharibacteria bacterium]
MRTCNNIYCHP